MKRFSLSIFITALVISLIGLLTILSTEIVKEGLFTWENIFSKQVIFVIFGFVIYFLTTKFDYTLLKYKPVVYTIYITTIIVLLLTAIFGQEVNGARRWFSFFGVVLQPSEFAKLTIIIVTAYIFNIENEMGEWKRLIISFLTILPIVFLVYIEPHGSMALIMMIIWFITAFIALGNQVRNLLMMLASFLIFIGLFLLTAFGNFGYIFLTILGLIISIFLFFSRDRWRLAVVVMSVLSITFGGIGSIIWNNVFDDYQRERVLTYVSPSGTETNSGFNVEQAKIAIGSGGIWGKGFANGSQTKLQILPFYQTDFIFASYAEEFGLVGALILLILYFILLWSIFIFSFSNPNYYYENLIIVAIGIKILIEIFINLGTNMGISPATGIPLPLFSAGGTITLVTFFSLGLIQGIIGSIKEQQTLILKD